MRVYLRFKFKLKNNEVIYLLVINNTQLLGPRMKKSCILVVEYRVINLKKSVFRLRFGLINSINTYLKIKICLESVLIE